MVDVCVCVLFSVCGIPAYVLDCFRSRNSETSFSVFKNRNGMIKQLRLRLCAMLCFLTNYLVVINNNNYYYHDTLCSGFPHHSLEFLYLQNIVKAHCCLFSAQWGCCEFCCNLPGGFWKPKTAVCAVHWKATSPHSSGMGDAAVRHRVCSYAASVEMCILFMLNYWGVSICPLGEYHRNALNFGRGELVLAHTA